MKAFNFKKFADGRRIANFRILRCRQSDCHVREAIHVENKDLSNPGLIYCFK
jgi:hypothetical protein